MLLTSFSIILLTILYLYLMNKPVTNASMEEPVGYTHKENEGHCVLED